MTDNSPPAFPLADVMGHVTDGMSLRDYIAVHAMAAIISKTPLEWRRDNTPSERAGPTAIGAYEYADKMLAERQYQRPQSADGSEGAE